MSAADGPGPDNASDTYIGIPIDRIQYSTLAGLLATLDCSAKTSNNIATVIRQPFVLALRDGRIKDNPA